MVGVTRGVVGESRGGVPSSVSHGELLVRGKIIVIKKKKSEDAGGKLRGKH